MSAVSPRSRARTNHPVRQPLSVDGKVGLVLAGLRGHRPVTELCREANVSRACYYQWRDHFIKAGATGLAHPESELQALEEHLRKLAAENASLRARVRIFQELSVAD